MRTRNILGTGLFLLMALGFMGAAAPTAQASERFVVRGGHSWVAPRYGFHSHPYWGGYYSAPVYSDSYVVDPYYGAPSYYGGPYYYGYGPGVGLNFRFGGGHRHWR